MRITNGDSDSSYFRGLEAQVQTGEHGEIKLKATAGVEHGMFL